MTGLSEKFQTAVAAAAAHRQKGEASALPLSIGIEGPVMSGKTYLAKQHIDALALHGLIEKGKVMHVNYGELHPRFRNDTRMIDATFAQAKDGVIVIDDIRAPRTPDDQDARAIFEKKILEAISVNKSIVILVGDEEGMASFRRNKPLADCICEFITITKEAPTALPHPIKPLKKFRLIDSKIPQK